MTSTGKLLRVALCATIVTLTACGDDTASTDAAAAGSSSGASMSTGTLLAGESQIALSSSSYVAAPASTAQVTISRNFAAGGSVTVGYTTQDGTAQSGVDYTATSGSLTWGAGDTADKVITVPVTQKASGRLFHIALISVSGSASLGEPNTATVIVDPNAVSSSGGSSAATGAVSKNGTVVTSNTAKITDSAWNRWSLSGGVVYVESSGAGAPVTAGYSANVRTLLYYNGTVYQENTACAWWSWNGTTWVASSDPDPSGTPACGTSASSSSASSSSSGGTTTGNQSPPPSTNGEFGVRVSGNHLVSTANGATVEIVGTNISGLETGMNWRWGSFSSAGVGFWSQVKNWGGSGVNAVRLPLNEASWLNYSCVDPGSGAAGSFYTAGGGGTYTPDPQGVYQQTVKKAVADATAAGLYVILDLHWGSPNNASGQALCPIGQPAFADYDHALTFWKQVADTFKGNPAVIFELFNEPFGRNVYGDWVSGATGAGPDALTLRDGGSYYPFFVQDNRNGAIESYNFTWRVAGMQDLINTIRGEGAENVILSSPIGWAGEIETWLASKPTDPSSQLGVAWHVYGYNKGQSYPSSVLSAGYPIVITETYGLGAIGGYGWTASKGIGYMWWGWNDWGGAALSSELGKAPWFDSTAP